MQSSRKLRVRDLIRQQDGMHRQVAIPGLLANSSFGNSDLSRRLDDARLGYLEGSGLRFVKESRRSNKQWRKSDTRDQCSRGARRFQSQSASNDSQHTESLDVKPAQKSWSAMADQNVSDWNRECRVYCKLSYIESVHFW